VREYLGHYGNDVHHLDVLESHDRLAVTAVSEVWTPQSFVTDRRAPTPPANETLAVRVGLQAR
jgi:hypothetical protein